MKFGNMLILFKRKRPKQFIVFLCTQKFKAKALFKHHFNNYLSLDMSHALKSFIIISKKTTNRCDFNMFEVNI